MLIFRVYSTGFVYCLRVCCGLLNSIFVPISSPLLPSLPNPSLNPFILFLPLSLTQGDDQDSSLDPDPELLQEIADAPTGMRDKDLRTMKDTLLIETVQLLGVGV